VIALPILQAGAGAADGAPPSRRLAGARRVGATRMMRSWSFVGSPFGGRRSNSQGLSPRPSGVPGCSAGSRRCGGRAGAWGVLARDRAARSGSFAEPVDRPPRICSASGAGVRAAHSAGTPAAVDAGRSPSRRPAMLAQQMRVAQGGSDGLGGPRRRAGAPAADLVMLPRQLVTKTCISPMRIRVERGDPSGWCRSARRRSTRSPRTTSRRRCRRSRAGPRWSGCSGGHSRGERLLP
jgi:hypothetical protein